MRSVLGLVYAGLGRKQEAIRQGRLAAEQSPIAEDAIKGPAFLEQLAAIYAAVGEPEAALDVIEQILAVPAEISVPMLQLDPRWRPLHDHPRFAALVADAAG